MFTEQHSKRVALAIRGLDMSATRQSPQFPSALRTLFSSTFELNLLSFCRNRASCSKMGYHSPFSTPEGTPLTPEIIDTSTPWSDVLLEDLRTTIEFNQPAKLLRRYGYANRNSCKSYLRGWSKAIWLSLIVVVGVWWGLRARRERALQSDERKALIQPKLDGLKHIEASHPYIRVSKLATEFFYADRRTVRWPVAVNS